MGQLYDRIGKGYDVTRRADPEIVHRIALHLRAHTGDPVIDVACGTGNYTVELAKKGLTMTGADISLEMLRKAQSKRDDISWVRAEANSLPFGDETFLGATCILAIHHFNDLNFLSGNLPCSPARTFGNIHGRSGTNEKLLAECLLSSGHASLL